MYWFYTYTCTTRAAFSNEKQHYDAHGMNNIEHE